MENDRLLEPGWTSRTITANGLRFHLVEAGRPSDRPIMLLHGFPEFWWAWRKQINPLVQAGFRVLAPDLRGYNLSDAPKGIACYRLDRLGSDVLAIANALGIARFVLAGHDWGGIIAWRVAAVAPERLAHLVIVDAPHPDIMASALRANPAQALRSAYIALFRLPYLPELILGASSCSPLAHTIRRSAHATAFEASALDQYRIAWSRPGRLTAMLNYYRALSPRHVTHPAPISVPTTILWGDQDSFLDLSVARHSLDRCSSGRLRVVSGASHWVHLERPDAVWHAITDI